MQVLEGTDCNSICTSTSGRYDNVIYSPALLNVRFLDEALFMGSPGDCISVKPLWAGR